MKLPAGSAVNNTRGHHAIISTYCCLFKKIILSLFIFRRAGFLLLRGFFSSCVKKGLPSRAGVWASYCSGFSCGARALGCLDSVAAAPQV